MPPTTSSVAPHGRSFAARNDQPSHTVGGIELLLSESFDRGRITPLRHAVTAQAARSGLAGDRRDDFIVAVNELLTNAVRHGGGTGRLSLWVADGVLSCEVTDSGAGLPEGQAGPVGRPAPDQPGGWGLWLAAELTDEFEVHTDASGTTVRIASRVG